MKVTRTAKIDGDYEEGSRKRVCKLNLVKQYDSEEIKYQWLQADDGADTGVSGKTVAEAEEAAAAVWGRGWNLRASWLR